MSRNAFDRSLMKKPRTSTSIDESVNSIKLAFILRVAHVPLDATGSQSIRTE